MKNLTKLSYPESEHPRRDRLNQLFTDLCAEIGSTSIQSGLSGDDLVLDGFYPYYESQNCKVLFVGRESLGLSGENYLDHLHWAYTVENRVGEKTLNQAQFHALKFYIAFGLSRGCLPFNEIPYASELRHSFATEGGFSYAFMNLSKFSNESDDWQADWSLIRESNRLVAGGSRNYLKEQVEILKPDLIVTMNLADYLPLLGEIKPIESVHGADYYWLMVSGRPTLLADLYHFSASLNQREYFYEPVMQGYLRYVSG